MRPKWKGLGSIYFKISSNLSTIFFDKIITDSKEMKIIYKNRFNKNSSMIAYGPTMIKLNNSKILRKYLLKQKSYYLIVGRLIPDNNSKLIIDGFIKSKSNKKIVIVGDVPYSDYYSQLVKSLANDRIVFLRDILMIIKLLVAFINTVLDIFMVMNLGELILQ